MREKGVSGVPKGGAMNIKIRLFGVFRIDRFKEETRSVPPGTSAREVAEELRLLPHLLGIVVINDRHANLDDTLQEGDTLALFPLLDGG
jgi:molybdopterin converting factor small subunit